MPSLDFGWDTWTALLPSRELLTESKTKQLRTMTGNQTCLKTPTTRSEKKVSGNVFLSDEFSTESGREQSLRPVLQSYKIPRITNAMLVSPIGIGTLQRHAGGGERVPSYLS